MRDFPPDPGRLLLDEPEEFRAGGRAGLVGVGESKHAVAQSQGGVGKNGPARQRQPEIRRP